jgi:hypothetical protein
MSVPGSGFWAHTSMCPDYLVRGAERNSPQATSGETLAAEPSAGYVPDRRPIGHAPDHDNFHLP